MTSAAKPQLSARQRSRPLSAIGAAALIAGSAWVTGCGVRSEAPPRAGPIGMPTHPPPPRLEGHHPRPQVSRQAMGAG